MVLTTDNNRAVYFSMRLGLLVLFNNDVQNFHMSVEAVLVEKWVREENRCKMEPDAEYKAVYLCTNKRVAVLLLLLIIVRRSLCRESVPISSDTQS